MSDELSPDLLGQLRDYIVREVRGGFTPVDEIPKFAIEYLADEVEESVLRPYADSYTAEALVALSDEQKAWPARTDCDRLDAAFARLDAVDILARQDFSCCQNCGHGEMWALVEEAVAEGRSIRGYAFYHQQDTEHAVEGDGLWLAWGEVDSEELDLGTVGREVVAALRGEGLGVTWDGNAETRISVSMEWKRRRD
jgi:hypothetical protein